MTSRAASLTLLALTTTAVALTMGCEALLANFFEERSGGDVTVVIVNNTDYRASFTMGAYDAFDLNPPGSIDMQQRRIEANTTDSFTLNCRRNVAIGTQALVDRVLDLELDNDAAFDADAFSTGVNFSSAPVGSDAAALPTNGTAAGREVLLGADYACADQLIFTFVEDATAAGGFRIQYQLLHTPEKN